MLGMMSTLRDVLEIKYHRVIQCIGNGNLYGVYPKGVTKEENKNFLVKFSYKRDRSRSLLQIDLAILIQNGWDLKINRGLVKSIMARFPRPYKGL